jgi:alpha-N-arabinofuranosidase
MTTPIRTLRMMALCLALAAIPAGVRAQTTLTIRADQITGRVNPMMYGLMTEEINYSYDGGLYGELVRNRNFKEIVPPPRGQFGQPPPPAPAPSKDPVHWQLVQERGGKGEMALDTSQPLNDAVPASLKLSVSDVSGDQRVGVANDGFWGIPVKPSTTYKGYFYAKASPGFAGAITIAIVGNDGGAVHASAQVPRIGETWRKYDVTLTTPAGVKASADNRLILSTNKSGTVWFGFVSLFPPTWKDRPNGNRKDIMQLMADMKPAFLRFPGGNYLEGNTIETRFDWKKTIGDVVQRPGHVDDAWSYWSSDGMGLLEFLEWCEDLNMQPVLAVYAGYSLRQIRVKPGADLDPYLKDALDEIEYVMGDASTTWGARRAKDGHPAPFKLEYVEVGNEDQFDNVAGSYENRFAQFFDGIKAKYPQLKVIATAAVTTRVPDVIDEHYYRRSEDEMAYHATDYDSRRRAGPKVFVGEWATRVGSPTPTMSAALGDASWMIGMERNADLVIMHCYAPLFVNVNPGGMQWQTDLIGYNTIASYGSPAYWAQQMFSTKHGDSVLSTTVQNVPNKEWQPPVAGRRGGGGVQTPQFAPLTPMAIPVPLMFFNATRDSASGTLYLKVVNRASTPQSVNVAISGLVSVEPRGKATTLSAKSPEETNTITEPNKIAPVTSNVDGLSANFMRTFPPYSITVLEMTGK